MGLEHQLQDMLHHNSNLQGGGGITTDAQAIVQDILG